MFCLVECLSVCFNKNGLKQLSSQSYVHFYKVKQQNFSYDHFYSHGLGLVWSSYISNSNSSSRKNLVGAHILQTVACMVNTAASIVRQM